MRWYTWGLTSGYSFITITKICSTSDCLGLFFLIRRSVREKNHPCRFAPGTHRPIRQELLGRVRIGKNNFPLSTAGGPSLRMIDIQRATASCSLSLLRSLPQGPARIPRFPTPFSLAQEGEVKGQKHRMPRIRGLLFRLFPRGKAYS